MCTNTPYHIGTSCKTRPREKNEVNLRRKALVSGFLWARHDPPTSSFIYFANSVHHLTSDMSRDLTATMLMCILAMVPLHLAIQDTQSIEAGYQHGKYWQLSWQHGPVYLAFTWRDRHGGLHPGFLETIDWQPCPDRYGQHLLCVYGQIVCCIVRLHDDHARQH